MSWKLEKLGAILDIQNGYAFDSKLFCIDGGIPLIRIRDLKRGDGTEINFSGSFDDKYIVKKGDYLIGMDGDFGCYEWLGAEALLNQRVCRLQNFSNNLLPRFLFYGINSYLKQIEEITSFTTVKHISSKQIANIEFPIPPLSTQQKIVEKIDVIFAEIDKAIAATEANIKNPEALFQSYLSNIQASKSTLGEHVAIKTGKLDSNASVENGKYPFFTCSKEIFSINDYAFDCEAVLLAGNNASGDFNVKHYKGKFNAYQRTYVITIDATDKLTYRYLYFQLVNALKRLKSMSVGANTKFLKIGMIRDLEIPLPKMDEQIKILENLNAIELKTDLLKDSYIKKLELTNKLKQSILKRAFNGELIKE